LFKIALSAFVISFVTLGGLGILPPTEGRTLVAQICTLVYFAFFILMPVYTSLDHCKPEPDRVTK